MYLLFIACGTAAFEFCTVCEDMTADSETAACEMCSTGYTLKDMNPEGPCMGEESICVLNS